MAEDAAAGLRELWRAVRDNNADAVAALLNDGVDPNRSLTPGEYVDELARVCPRAGFRRNSPAHEIFAGLVEGHADGRGFFVIGEAAGKPEVLFNLLAGGAFPDTRLAMHRGGTLLHCPEVLHDPDTGGEIVRLLLEAGATVDARDDDKSTPLHIACWAHGSPGPIIALLAGRASATARDAWGRTPLHCAVCTLEGRQLWPLDEFREGGWPIPESHLQPSGRYWGAKEAVAALVRAGADPNAVNPRSGMTPMDETVDDRPYRCGLRALFRHGGDPGRRGRDGARPADFYPQGHPGGDLALLEAFAQVVSPPPKFLDLARERVRDAKNSANPRERALAEWID